MAPSKACRPQSTKLPQPEVCNVSWADALDFLRLYLLGQQTRLSFPTPLQGLSESAPGRALRPKLAWDRGQKRNSGALPGPRSRNMAKCPAPDRTQVCRHPPPFPRPAPRLCQRVGSDLDCPAGAGVVVCRERTATPGLSECLTLKKTEKGSHGGLPSRTCGHWVRGNSGQLALPSSFLQSAPRDLAALGSLGAWVGAHQAASQTWVHPRLLQKFVAGRLALCGASLGLERPALRSATT